ncbi:unnamed protein product [Tilletia controversa]|nr:hypothetical protein CF335_g5519 [Tilletia laevis]CAD6897415.1 unnamed protein product [Tilletia controversa]CAD6926349.1 unnamed protein product [Tilletia controversa]CAD6959031.1 unnamed protein product [Tilletia caries]
MTPGRATQVSSQNLDLPKPAFALTPSTLNHPLSTPTSQPYKMSYTIAGRKILNEHIALGTFALYGALAFAATAGGGKDKSAAPGTASSASVREPALNASTSDEEAFIKQFLAEEGKNERLV